VRAHERIHSDVRPYGCALCGKTFKTSECLWHHENRSKTCGKMAAAAAAASRHGLVTMPPRQRQRRVTFSHDLGPVTRYTRYTYSSSSSSSSSSSYF